MPRSDCAWSFALATSRTESSSLTSMTGVTGRNRGTSDLTRKEREAPCCSRRVCVTGRRNSTSRALRGPRSLYAYLSDAQGREPIDTWGMTLVFDDEPPHDPQIIDLPNEIEPTATSLTAKATVTPPVSKIKDVSFLVNPGVRGDFAKAEAENKLIPGKLSASTLDTWEAVIPVPKGASGKLVVSVRFTSGVGLTGLAHGELSVRQLGAD